MNRDTPAPRDMTCERCGTAFECRLNGACWCKEETMRLPLPTTGSMADCLCPTCLRAAAERSR